MKSLLQYLDYLNLNWKWSLGSLLIETLLGCHQIYNFTNNYL